MSGYGYGTGGGFSPVNAPPRVDFNQMRSRSNRKALAVILAFVASILGVFQAHHMYLEHRLESVASKLAGHDVNVHCNRFWTELFETSRVQGFVPYDSGKSLPSKTFIRRHQCLAIAKTPLIGWPDVNEMAGARELIVAVHVLTHESMHMKGIYDEATAECSAMQRNAETARELGADPAVARAISRYYWETFYPNQSSPYSSAECRPGGQLDEELPDAPWGETPAAASAA